MVVAVILLVVVLGFGLFIYIPWRILRAWNASGKWRSMRAPWKRQAVYRSLIPLCTLAVVLSKELSSAGEFHQLWIVIPAFCIALSLTVADWDNLRRNKADFGDDRQSSSLFLACFKGRETFYRKARPLADMVYMNVFFPILLAASQAVLRMVIKESGGESQKGNNGGMLATGLCRY
ncbi:hypothetical protein [Gordonia paraffinivorans]|uniref:hypothetical protein n=1 Tax=Gordonia paraffinivorans TaxID=175628 RepID=UPI001C92F992|nr:hypothetical protein [Gordonia paraffinivorans]